MRQLTVAEELPTNLFRCCCRHQIKNKCMFEENSCQLKSDPRNKIPVISMGYWNKSAERIVQGYFRGALHVWICYNLVLQSFAKEHKECKAAWGFQKSSFQSTFRITQYFQETEKRVPYLSDMGMDRGDCGWRAVFCR